MKRAALFICVLLLACGCAAQPSPQPIDKAHSRVTFTVTKWGFAEVEGRFYNFSGDLAFDEKRPEQSKVDWRVRIDSVETGAPNRDKALLGSDYFDAARFPEMRFVSERVTALGGGRYEVKGLLTIRDKSKPVTIRATYGGTHTIPNEGTYTIFQTEFTIDRYDFDVKGGSMMGAAISREVNIKLIAAARS